MQEECMIVAAGPSPVYLRKNAYIIAADGGNERLGKLGICPDLIIGDFDSSSSVPSFDNVIKFPKEKDDTDTMLAIKKALSLGFKKIYISGGLGGRLDHTLANIQSLCYALDNGALAFLCGENETVFVLSNGKTGFSCRCKGHISLFAISDRVCDVNISGLKYSLSHGELTNAFPLGVSNEFTGHHSEISCGEGKLLIIYSGSPDDAETAL